MAPTIMTDVNVHAGKLMEIWFPPEPSGEHLCLSWSKDQDEAHHLRRMANWILAEFGPDRTM